MSHAIVKLCLCLDLLVWYVQSMLVNGKLRPKLQGEIKDGHKVQGAVTGIAGCGADKH
jgi:hypothetical protein